MAQFLQTKRLGFFDATGTSGNIFIHALPPAPDEVIAIYATGGSHAESINGKRIYFRQHVQILVRAINSLAAGEKAYAIYQAVNHFSGYLMPEGNYVSLILSYPPAHIGVDRNGRHEFSINFVVRLEEMTDG
ncbi:minor capsid protein [Laceyella tengchongensis]|nr:minor capsid protein [Laceyella tengchongensis]